MSRSEVYLLTTTDKYELPVGVYDTIPDMAKALGRKPGTLRPIVSRVLRGLEGRSGLRINGKRFRLYKIELGGDED